MPFSEKDKIIIKHYRIEKGYGRTKLLDEFPNKGWTLGGLGTLLRKIDETGCVVRKEGSGRPRRDRTEENINDISVRILSQEDNTLLATRILQMKSLANGQNFVFQQDGARAHTAKDTVALYLHENVPELILPENWPGLEKLKILEAQAEAENSIIQGPLSHMFKLVHRK